MRTCPTLAPNRLLFVATLLLSVALAGCGQGTPQAAAPAPAAETAASLATEISAGALDAASLLPDTITSEMLANAAATSTLFTVDSSATGIRAFRMDYTIKRGTTYRTGTITIVSGTTFSFTDDYSDNASTGFVLSAAEATPGLVIVSYADGTPTGTDGSITYSITHLA